MAEVDLGGHQGGAADPASRQIWGQAGLRVLELAERLARQVGAVVETPLLESDGQRVSRRALGVDAEGHLQVKDTRKRVHEVRLIR